MKNIKLILFVVITCVLLGSCIKEEEKICGCMDTKATNFEASANCEDNSCKYMSYVVFWTNAVYVADDIYGKYNVTVEIGDHKGNIAMRYDGSYLHATCAAVKLPKFHLEPGTYTYHAVYNADPNQTWDGTVTLKKMDRMDCHIVELE